MQIQQIHLEGFGTLADLTLSGIPAELTVVYGANGSGKTTLLHFLRGVLCGFQDARRLRLLPPLKSGTPGGRISVADAGNQFEIIRHARADHSDTLAIQLRQGTANDVAALRTTIQSFDASLVSTLFAVSGTSSQDLDGLVALARRDGVDLASRRASTSWIAERIREVEHERSDLFQGPPPRGRIATLEQQRDRLARELQQVRQLQSDQLENWKRNLEERQRQIEELQREVAWLAEELQAAETDLCEVQTRLWSTRVDVVQEVQRVPRPSTVRPDWTPQIEQIDAEIAHAQQVLRDLAGSRLSLSMAQADLSGADVPDPTIAFQRQRSALSVMEKSTEDLLELAARMQTAAQCMCRQRSADLEAAAGVLREQIWMVCQELSRQQTAHQHWLVQSQRAGIDQCELELTRQIQRLRLRRDELVHQHQRTMSQRLQFRTPHESQYCECHGHELEVAPSADRNAAPQLIVRECRVTSSAARPGDEELQTRLMERRQQLRQQWLAAGERLRDAWSGKEQLEQGARRFASDQTAQKLRHDFAAVEQQLADGREQWHSLALLQTVLQRTQERLNVETGSLVIEEASQFLQRMTGGRYLRFRCSAPDGEISVVNQASAELRAPALSRGTLEQAVLSLRLALCREYQRRGIRLPLILDDVLADSDEHRSSAAVEVLMEFARSHQVLFLTCQEHLVELFAAHQASIQELPGSTRRSSALSRQPRSVPAVETVAEEDSDVSQRDVFSLDRVQPDEPFWLHPGSPIRYVPSLGEQMARRLGALGVRNVDELVQLDPEVSEMPLDSLQISASRLRLWQAEARLLCCVPDLTGRDAQLLAACGVHTAAELAECDARELHNRVSRLRAQQSQEYSLPWLQDRPDWPSQDQLQRWVHASHSARSWRGARDWAARRPAQQRQFAGSSRQRDAVQSATLSPLKPAVRLSEPAQRRQWKFHLQHSSPIIDAPSIGPKTAERLQSIGVVQVMHLLQQEATDIARRLNRREITAEVVTAWQHQSSLMCRVPELRGHDAQVLVACGVTDPEVLAGMSAAALFQRIGPFVSSPAGQRLLRSAKTPDLAEVTSWIESARHSPLVRAA